MSRSREVRYFVGDFETTVFEGQTYTEVWASAVVEFGSENVEIFHSIEDTFDYLKSLKTNIVIYYHNLKFDGHFWLDLLMRKLKYQQATKWKRHEDDPIEFLDDQKMPSRSFKYLISDMGQWYEIKIKVGEKIIEIRDSLKILPFSVKAIGKAFATKHQKLEMEYEGFRYAGCEITDDEKKYISNDVLVVKEALELMFSEGHRKLTIGACCSEEFKSMISKKLYESWFPDLYEIYIDEGTYGAKTAGEYIRKSYRGGWCYVVKGKEKKLFRKGLTLDVNSLYPSMMSSESGNFFPVGKPHFWTGDIPDVALINRRYYFVKIRTRFYLKEGYLPFIQIKRNFAYRATECLTTSDIRDKDGVYHRFYKDFDGTIKPALVELTLTMTDYELLKKHYNLEDTVILSGCWFESMKGIFDEYINKYKKIKQESTSERRTLAKLFLNNLYGRLAMNTDSSFKFAYLDENNVIRFQSIKEGKKKPGYIACGSAITSFARCFTISAAQSNYHGIDQPGTIYSDTDSIHCDLSEDEIQGVRIDDKEFCCWKVEQKWDYGWFVRQKTYIEMTEGDMDIKCAGMPEVCKKQFVEDVQNGGKTIRDFDLGLEIYGKLLPKTILGGVVLEETSFKMR